MDTSAWFWFHSEEKYNYTPKEKTNQPESWAKFPNDKSILVSTYGRVKHNGRLLKQCNSNGYRRAAGHLTHRLVATTFLPNPDNLPIVNHIDGNRANNNVDNLEWVSNKENTDHARYYLHGRLLKKVRRIEDGEIFNSAGEAARVMGCSEATIRHACSTGKPGMFFHWEYIKQ